MNYYLGLDFGTSGARACAVDKRGVIQHEARTAYANPDGQTPQDWREALLTLLHGLPPLIATQLHGIAVDATSATVLLCDAELTPLYPQGAGQWAPGTPARGTLPDTRTSSGLGASSGSPLPHSPVMLYADNRASAEADELRGIAPPGHVVCSATSGLAKFLWLARRHDAHPAAHFLHQADWLTALLTGQGGVSDYHNALKTGYDAERLCWPDWVLALPHAWLLPQVLAPGKPIAPVRPEIAQHFGINPACRVHAGTTDSIAAFIASGANDPGMAVTSLGTTIVLKLLSERRVESAEHGVYSHRYGDLWLAGGASNAGGGVLRRHFSDEQLAALSARINPDEDSPLDYYPLPRPGERFPVNDLQLAPRITPRPADDAQFLHGLLQGLSRIEAAGYAKLAELGATPLQSVATCGGGAQNPAWQAMRQRLLGVPVSIAQHAQAAYGSALLALRNPR